MIWPVQPSRGARDSDPMGAGHFGASRGKKKHAGLDCTAHPGDLVVAPFEATVTHIGVAYDDGNLASIHLHDTAGRFACKILYASPQCHLAQLVTPGQVIGFAQDVASYHEAKNPAHKGMTNHVHVELRLDNDLVDPAEYLEES